MADIIIRKAKKDYVCNVCGHIIKEGSEYLDKVITHDGKVVRHERYHDECPAPDSFVRFAKSFAESEETLCKGPDYNKYRVTGIIRPKTVVVQTWDRLRQKNIPFHIFEREWALED